MIVNQIKDGWEIIFQPAHGLLAAQIAHKYQADKFVKNYLIETVTAIQSHDDHQIDFDKKNYVTDVGAPKDFSLETSNQNKICQQVSNVTAEAFRKSCWTGVLVSYHCEYLYRKADPKKKLRKLLDQLKKKRKEIFNSTSFTKEQMRSSYDILRFCDRLSLILTRKNIPENNRKIEIITNHQGQMFFLKKCKEGHLKVEPWIFDEKKIMIKVETMILNQLHFKNDKDLQKAISKGKIAEKRWIIKKT